VVDIPPVSEGDYAIRAAAALDVVILAVEAGRVPWRTVLRTASLLTDAKAAVGGIILNRQRFTMPAWLYRKL
jgi:Mrp family chromosome partitioning ATPase